MSSLCSSMYSRNDDDQRGGLLAGLCGVPGEEHLVLGHLVDRLLVGLADVEDRVAQVGVGGQRFQGLGEHGGRRRGDGRRVVCGLACRYGGGDLLVGIERVHQAAGDRAQVGASGQAGEHVPVVLGQVLVQAGQPPGDGGRDLRVLAAEGDLLEQVLQALGRACVPGAARSRRAGCP